MSRLLYQLSYAAFLDQLYLKSACGATREKPGIGLHPVHLSLIFMKVYLMSMQKMFGGETWSSNRNGGVFHENI